MTATPTPLRELLAMTLQHVRLCAPDATIEAALEAALSARDAAGAVEVVDRPAGGAAAFESAMGKVLRPHISTARERAAACNLFRAWFDYANRATPPASGEADPQNWPQWVKDAVRNANEAGRHAGRAEATPSAASGEELIDANDNADYIEHCADRLARCGYRITGSVLRVIAAEYRRLAAVAPASDHIDAMVNRFLGWRLPDDFAPDNGISYAPIPRHPDWTHDTHPTGTNLFHAGQARAMFAHCVAAVAPAGMVLVPRKQIEELAEILGDGSTTTSSGLPVTVLELIDAQQGAAGELRRMLAAAPTPPATAGKE